MEITKVKSLVINFALAILLLVIGGFLNSYFFKDKPELTYRIYEVDPIETELGVYYSTKIMINNSGDTPLSEVVVFLRFNGKIIKSTSNIYSGSVADDSITIKREFRMPINTYIEIGVTSRGKITEVNISSAEVSASKKDNTQDDKKKISDLVTALFLVVMFLVFTIIGMYSQAQEIKKYKKTIATKLEERNTPLS